MADDSKIEWTDASLNPVRARNRKTGKLGWFCTHASPGCLHCYAEKLNTNTYFGNGVAYKPGNIDQVEIVLDEDMLLRPLRWRRPRKIFWGSMTDLFGEWMTDEMLDRIFAVMALTPQHTHQVLTKRSARLRAYCTDPETPKRVLSAALDLCRTSDDQRKTAAALRWPLRNAWLGVSAEDQRRADERVPDLLATPAAVRFVSAEPLLGPIDFEAMPFGDGDRRHKWSALTGQAIMYASGENGHPDFTVRMTDPIKPCLDWIIAGGESGPNARPMHPDWACDIRDQCEAAGVAFFFKQNGAWAACPASDGKWPVDAPNFISLRPDGTRGPDGWPMQRVGKRAAGRLLDGVTHDAMPEART